MNTARKLLSWVLGLAAALALLWLVTGVYAQGQTLWALGLLLLGGSGLGVYMTARSPAWRYLYPGVAAMLVFVAAPLLYTMQIGFTNYSSSNLLSQERARAYLLEQADVDEAQAMVFTLHPEGDKWRLLLSPPDDVAGDAAGVRYMSAAPVALDQSRSTGAPVAPVTMQALPNPTPALGRALELQQVLQLRDGLMPLRLTLPDQRQLIYAGVREFAPFDPVWQGNADGTLSHRRSGKKYHANTATGFFEDEAGQRLQPGFKVGVGWANYTRLFGDADMRGPFVSIFIWTVLFSALTVLFSASIGMTLAVVLNWEALRFRTLYRTLLFLPYAVPGFISILVFKGLFNQNFGEINTVLNALFGIKPAWFADPLLAKTMLVMVNTWLGYPYFLVICTGLIKAIPADLYEASAIAGASPWTNFRRITAPLIARPLMPLLISAFAFNFNNFVLISLLTDGRPDYLNTKLPAGTTDILVSYTYRIAFTDAGTNFGLAAAISTVIFFLVALLSMLNLRATRAPSTRS